MRRLLAVLFWLAALVVAWEWVVRPLVRLAAGRNEGPWM